ncbi:MAG: DUF4349 domain-containing protein [Firmicutes bacterium]|nr:DUF4349 domain-containing protein [Bacillota bacterium]
MKKQFDKKICSLFLILALTLGLLTGCGGGASMEGGADMAPGESFDKFESSDMGFIESESNGSSGSASTRPYGDDVKLILRANLTLETTDFDDSVTKLNQLVADCGGYYEQSNVDMGSYYSSGYRYGRYTVRVPKDNYDRFLNSVGEVCHLTSRNESAEDVGLQYYDIESKIRLLEIKQDRLMKLLEQSSTMEDIITLENALSDIQYQLEQFNSQKNRYDSLIGYSTVEIRLEQVQRLSGEPMEQQSFGSQLGTALTEGLLNTLDAFSELLLTIAYNIIPLTIFIVIVICFSSLLKKRRRNRMMTGSYNGGNQKKWFRKKGQTVGESSPDGDFIPPSSEDPVDRK